MKNINILLILFCIFLSVAASVTTSRMTVEPAKPKSVIVLTNMYNTQIKAEVLKYSKQGYVVTQMVNGRYQGEQIVVLSRY